MGLLSLPLPQVEKLRLHWRDFGLYSRSEMNCRWSEAPRVSITARLARPHHTLSTVTVPSIGRHVCEFVNGPTRRVMWTCHFRNCQSKARCAAESVPSGRATGAAASLSLERSAMKLVSQDLPPSLENACSKW